MKYDELSISDVILFTPEIFGDDRGYFFETYHEEKFRKAGFDFSFVQQNQSGSRHGILRGLHYQIKNIQGKYVRVIRGKIFDVAVDLRKNSSSFGKWVGVVLDSENKKALWVPPGFAHGFYVMSDWAEIVYNTTDFYAPEHERTIIWSDPFLNIDWPIEGHYPILSEKDKNGRQFKESEYFEVL